MKIDFVQEDPKFYYTIRDELKPLYNQYVEIHGFLGCAPYGTFLYNNLSKREYFIEIFSPGLERQLPEEYFHARGGGLHGILEEVFICGKLNAATSFRGQASLSDIQYINVKTDDGSIGEYRPPQNAI